MKLLIVSATAAEIQPFLDWCIINLSKDGQGSSVSVGETKGDILITGVGMAAATYALTKQLLSGHYDLVLQVGVCGCFDDKFSLGDVVYISTERFGDLGAEDHNDYLD